MRQVNVIAVFNEAADQLLFCERRRDPYKGLLNLVGGKIEPGEDHLDAAYRELWEETAITREDIRLIHLMDFRYYLEDTLLEVYAGRLNKPVEVRGDENELRWLGTEQDFFSSGFAGEGNMGHIMEIIRKNREHLLV